MLLRKSNKNYLFATLYTWEKTFLVLEGLRIKFLNKLGIKTVYRLFSCVG